uniref:Uncharacterized protein n=1 Tax=Anguilla anguilla TaxID=7936 RepID=A0A0E9QNM7_ANGAN
MNTIQNGKLLWIRASDKCLKCNQKDVYYNVKLE